MRFFLVALAAMFALAPVAPAQAALFNSQAALDASDDLANDPMFQSVGYIEAWDSGGSFLAGGGVLIHDEWVLTAGHVALDDSVGNEDGLFLNYEFSLNNNFFVLPTNGVTIDQVYVYPGYSEISCGAGSCVDLALMHLSTPVTDVLEAVIGTSVLGDHFYGVGYGRPGLGFTEGAFDGVLRAGENVIDCVQNVGDCTAAVNSHYLESEYDTAAGENPLPMEWRVSQWDSGGGWFNDNGELIGISSCVRGISQNCGIEVAQFGSWINTTTGEQLYAVPEPSTGLLVALGLAALARYGRRA